MEEPAICFDFTENHESTCKDEENVFQIRENIKSGNIGDASKLAAFFGMTHQTFIKQLTNPESSLGSCLDFLHTAEAEGFDAFQNIYNICHVYDDNVYGNHFLIASKGRDENRVMINMKTMDINYDRQMLPIVLKNPGSHIYLGQKQTFEEPADSRLEVLTMTFAMLAQYSSWLVKYLGDQITQFGSDKELCGKEFRENALAVIENLKKETLTVSLTDSAKEEWTQRLIWLEYFIHGYLVEVQKAVKHKAEYEQFLKFLENQIKQHCHKTSDKTHTPTQYCQKFFFTPDNPNPQVQFGDARYEVKISISNMKSPQADNHGSISYFAELLRGLMASIVPTPESTQKIKNHELRKKYWNFVTDKDSVYLQPCLCDTTKSNVAWLCATCHTLLLTIDGSLCCSCRIYAPDTLYCSSECNVFKMDNFIPHYSKKSHQCKIDETFKPELIYNVIAAADLHDGVKLAQFFNVTHDYLFQSLIRPDDCEIDNCMRFMEENCLLDYKSFVNCVIFCGKRTDDGFLCGSHNLIALKPDQEDIFLQLLEEVKRGVEPSNMLSTNGTLKVFPNFKDNFDVSYKDFYTYYFKPEHEQPHLPLGESGKTHIPTEPTMESSKVECMLIGKELLVSLTKRLNTSFDVKRLLKQLKAVKIVIPSDSLDDVIASANDNSCKGAVEVKGVTPKLAPLLKKLNETSNPLEIKEIETSVAQFLTILMRFCWFSKKPGELKNVLAGLLSKVEEIDYKMDSGLWCIGNDAGNADKNDSPIIRVRRLKVEEFKAFIGEQKASLFPISIVPDEENEADYMLDLQKLDEKRLVLKFVHNTAPTEQLENASFTIPYSGPCLCNSEEKPARLCKNCQMVLFVTTSTKIRCLCTFYDPSEIRCSESCATPVSSNHHCDQEDDWHDGDLSSSQNNLNSWQIITQHDVSVPTYTIVVAGSTGAGKSTFLNSIYCMQQNGTFDKAIERKDQNFLLPVKIKEYINDELHVFEYGVKENANEEFSDGHSTTQQPKDYIVDYGDFKVRFVDTPGINDTRGNEQDKTNVKYIQDHLTSLDTVHGFLFVIKTDDSKLTPDFRHTMNMLLELLPRKALDNCCFVYTFSAITSHFTPGPARQAVQAFFNEFCDKHRLPELQLTDRNQYCVDNEAFRNIVINHQGGALHDLQRYRSSWEKTAHNVNRLLERMKLIDPVTQNEFKSAKLLNELGVCLRSKQRGKKEATDETKRLMATVAEFCLSGIALFCRQRKGEAEPVTNLTVMDAAINYWRIDIIGPILTDLRKTLFNAEL